MRRLLHCIEGPDKDHRFLVSDTFTTCLGRSKHANTQLKDTSVSRLHCEVEIRNQRVFLTDLDSASGTFVNDKRVEDCELKDGDVIRLGNDKLVVENPDGEPETIVPNASIPPRPVLKSSTTLHGLTGHKLSYYQVGPMIAKGQSGLVFKAQDLKNERSVALKVLWPEFSQNEEDMQRFIRAMKTMMPLRHPNLVTLYGAGKNGPYCYVAMEFVEGESLTQIIERIGAANMLEWKRVLRISYYLAKALEYAHGKLIVHRNLTPQNVMVGKTPDQTKLGDLMLAKAQEGGLAQQITKPGEIIGDIRYMPPERTGSALRPDGRSDLYSLGALMYAMLTGRAPFDETNIMQTIAKICHEEPIKPTKFQMSIVKPFEGIVLKLLAKRPEERYASATALIKEFDRVVKQYGITI